MACYCIFNLQFLNDLWCWANLHEFILPPMYLPWWNNISDFLPLFWKLVCFHIIEFWEFFTYSRYKFLSGVWFEIFPPFLLSLLKASDWWRDLRKNYFCAYILSAQNVLPERSLTYTSRAEWANVKLHWFVQSHDWEKSKRDANVFTKVTAPQRSIKCKTCTNTKYQG